MSALLYAIADCEPEAAPDRTRGGRPLRVVGEHPPVAILAGDAAAIPAASAAALAEHERTVTELMDGRTLLPARYGTVLTEAEARRWLTERRGDLLAALELVRGAVELSLRARLWSTARAGASESGRAYLHARLAERHERERVQALLAELGDLARAWREGPAGTAARELRLAYLVPRPALDDFVAAVQEIDTAHPELELVCSGPWPPYSFVGGR